MTFSIPHKLTLWQVLEEVLPPDGVTKLMALPDYDYTVSVLYGEEIIVSPISMNGLVACLEYIREKLGLEKIEWLGEASRKIFEASLLWSESREAQELAEWTADELCKSMAAN